MSTLLTSQDDITKLAACFTFNINTSSGDRRDLKLGLKIRINDLPRHLRRYSITDQFLNKAKIRKDEREINPNRALCSFHNEIYSVATLVIFESLQTKLISAIQKLGGLINSFGPDEEMTIRRVAAIQEMWAQPWRDVSNERWKYQADQCEACMLSRVATDPSTLRELRTVILAHAGLKAYKAWPIILTFLDEWIKLTDQTKKLFDTSEERAKEMRYCIDQARLHKNLKAAQAAKKEAEKRARKQQAQNAHGLETLPALCYNLTPSLTHGIPNPLFSSTLNRPLSRNEYEFSEAEFLHEFSPSRPSYRASSTIDDNYDVTDEYSQDNDTGTNLGLSKTLAVLQKQQILDQYRDPDTVEGGRRSPETGLSSRLYGPWSSTDEIRGSYSRFSETTVSSPGYRTRRSELSPPISPLISPVTPDRYRYDEAPVSPLTNSSKPPDRYVPPPKTPKTPDRNRALLPIPEVSPFHMSPFISSSSAQNTHPSSSRGYASVTSSGSSCVSAFSPGEEVVGTEMMMRKGQGRVVHVKAARDGKRYMPK